MNFEELRRTRESLGLHQSDLAHILGVDQGTISGWELGKHKPHPIVAEKLKQVLSDLRKRHKRK